MFNEDFISKVAMVTNPFSMSTCEILYHLV